MKREERRNRNRIAKRISRENKPIRDVGKQQCRLFCDDPRRHRLEELWGKSRRRSKTHFDELSEVGLYILQHGRTADQHTYTLVNTKQLEVLLSPSWIAKPKLIVLRDPVWYNADLVL